MNSRLAQPVITVDVGNTSIHFGYFASQAFEHLPQPSSTFQTPTAKQDHLALENWLSQFSAPQINWAIISVNQPGLLQFQEWAATSFDQNAACKVFSNEELPIQSDVRQIERVGTDRLVAAVAGNRLRKPGHGLVIVDAGSAITVDLIDKHAVFQGGAILPGLKMVATSLAGHTDALPFVEVNPAEPPPIVGKDTVTAMQSGMFWGQVGAVDHLIQKYKVESPEPLEVILAGGDATKLQPHLPHDCQSVEHLVLCGIAVCFADSQDLP